jgi:hypothetical protein
MNEEPLDTDRISYEVLEDSFDVNWNWDTSYRTRGVNIDENVMTIDHPSRSQGEVDLGDEHLQNAVQPTLRASHRKRIVKSYSKDGSRHNLILRRIEFVEAKRSRCSNLPDIDKIHGQ